MNKYAKPDVQTRDTKERKPHSLKKNGRAREEWQARKREGRTPQVWVNGEWGRTNLGRPAR